MYEPLSSGGPDLTAQIHDFNPGITQNGVFWTVVLPSDSVHVSPNVDAATLEVSHFAQKDYTHLENALFGGIRAVPGRVSFKVEWNATGAPVSVNNPEQQYRAVVRAASAQMEWSAQTTQFDFQSDALETSSSEDAGAQLGMESNGSYYPSH